MRQTHSTRKKEIERQRQDSSRRARRAGRGGHSNRDEHGNSQRQKTTDMKNESRDRHREAQKR